MTLAHADDPLGFLNRRKGKMKKYQHVKLIITFLIDRILPMEETQSAPYNLPVRNPDASWGQGGATGSISSLNRRPAAPFQRMVPINVPLVQRVQTEDDVYTRQRQHIDGYFNRVDDEVRIERDGVPANQRGPYDNHRISLQNDRQVSLQLLQNSYMAFRAQNPVNVLGNRLIERPVIGVDPGCKFQVVGVNANLGELAIECRAALEDANANWVGGPNVNVNNMEAQREIGLQPVRNQVKAALDQTVKRISGKEYRYVPILK